MHLLDLSFMKTNISMLLIYNACHCSRLLLRCFCYLLIMVSQFMSMFRIVDEDAAKAEPAVEPRCGWQLEVRWQRFADLSDAWEEIVRKLGGWVL